MADTSVSFKCPSCGAPLEYAPGQENITCMYCESSFDIKGLEEYYAHKEEMAAKAEEAREAKWDTENAGNQWSQEEAALLRAFTCSSCAAEIVCDENTMATECVYCGNPTMIPARFSGMLKPDYIIPFKKTKEEAVAQLTEFCKGKRVLPSNFTANNRVEDIQGMYVPFWLFDSAIEASGTFKAEDDYVYDTEDATITETSVYECTRTGEMAFEKIPCDGSKRMDDTYMESIEPYDYKEMVPFTNSYMAGYLADKYDVSAEDNVDRADKRVESSAVNELGNTVTGYMRVTPEEDAIIKKDGKVEYAMAPVWILTTRYNNEPYTFMMNGQTGKFIGKLPIDNGKLWMYTLGTFAICIYPLYRLLKYFL